MSDNLLKEQIKINEVICSKYEQHTIGTELIVPDTKPDVLKVVRTSANAAITDRVLKEDRAFITGKVFLTVLYIPENCENSKLKAVNSVLDFNYEVSAMGALPDMCVMAEAECENAVASLINSRKLGIKCTVGINVKISRAKEVLVAVGKEEDSKLVTKCSDVKFLNTAQSSEKEFFIRERVSAPRGSCEIFEILKVSPVLSTSELKLSNEKAALKGEMQISVLYQGVDGKIEAFENTIMFTEVFDTDEIKDTMDNEVDYFIKDITYSICSSDGETADSIDLTVQVGVEFKGTETRSYMVVEDAFCTNCPVDIKKKAYDLERLVDSQSIQFPQKEILELPSHMPQIQNVCELSAFPRVTDISVSGKCATVKGIINIQLLYLTDCEECPASGYEADFEFSREMQLSEESCDSICEAKASLEHLSYSICSEKSIEIRLISTLSLKCITTEKTEIVDEVIMCEDDGNCQCPMVIYFVQPGDSLWSIAKNFRTPEEKILEDNNLSRDDIKQGTRLMIYR